MVGDRPVADRLARWPGRGRRRRSPGPSWRCGSPRASRRGRRGARRRRSGRGASSTSSSAAAPRTRRASRSPRRGSPRRSRRASTTARRAGRPGRRRSAAPAAASAARRPSAARAVSEPRRAPRRPARGSPVQHQITAATFCICSSSGNGGAGGTVRKAKKPPSSSGAFRMNSRYQRISSGALSSDQNIGPATTLSIGCSLAVIEVTTPKLPPPPRIAQNRSGFSFSFAWTTLPSASTTSAPRMLSIERPSPARQVADPAAEHQPACAGGGDDPRRRRQAVLVRGRVDVAEQRAAADLDGAVLRVDLDAVQLGEVDHEPVVDARETRAVVAAAADREVEPVLAPVVDRGDDVVHVRRRARSAPAACRSSRCRAPAPRRSRRLPGG